MKTIQLTVYSFLLSFSALAQDYAPILPGKTLYYFNPKEEARAIRIDATRIAGDWTQYFNYSIISKDPYDENCYGFKQFQPGWLGKSISMHKDSATWVFLTAQNESLYIKTHAAIGEHWHCFTHHDTINEINAEGEAYVSEIKPGVIFGEADTFKTIILDISSNSEHGDELNYTRKIILSKNHGLIRFFDIAYFPYTNHQFLVENSDEMVSFTQQGQRAPALGKQLITNKEIFDHEINDEFHFRENYYSYFDYSQTIRSRTRKIINKTFSHGDSVVAYTFVDRVFDKDYSAFHQTTSTSYSTHTTTETHSLYSKSDAIILPYERLDSTDMPYYTTGGTSSRQQRIIHHENTDPASPSDTCLGYFIDGGPYYETYTEGLGNTSYSGESFWGSHDMYLVYYKKPNQSGGTPINMDSLMSIPEQKELPLHVDLYPNPANISLQILSNEPNTNPVQLQLYTNTGELVLDQQLNSEEPISIEHLPPGLYAALLRDSDGHIQQEKLIIQR